MRTARRRMLAQARRQHAGTAVPRRIRQKGAPKTNAEMFEQIKKFPPGVFGKAILGAKKKYNLSYSDIAGWAKRRSRQAWLEHRDKEAFEEICDRLVDLEKEKRTGNKRFKMLEAEFRRIVENL
ncbi:MAG TPA: hypothetical protein VI977_06595 [archaeon]|nr:hypothetical protein [archaeon]